MYIYIYMYIIYIHIHHSLNNWWLADSGHITFKLECVEKDWRYHSCSGWFEMFEALGSRPYLFTHLVSYVLEEIIYIYIYIYIYICVCVCVCVCVCIGCVRLYLYVHINSRRGSPLVVSCVSYLAYEHTTAF